MRLVNVPKATIKVVSTLQDVDVTNKTVIERGDGNYQIFESSETGLQRLSAANAAHLRTNFDMTQVPEDLKCPLSNTFLKEAVSMPCCNNLANDSVVREELIKSGLKCPFCRTDNISPDTVSTFPPADLFTHMHCNPIWIVIVGMTRLILSVCLT